MSKEMPNVLKVQNYEKNMKFTLRYVFHMSNVLSIHKKDSCPHRHGLDTGLWGPSGAAQHMTLDERYSLIRLTFETAGLTFKIKK